MTPMAAYPLIGISGWIQRSETHDLRGVPLPYIEAVEAAGGLPVLLPPGVSQQGIDAWLDRLDGLVLSGGLDIDPARYGEERHPACGPSSSERDDHDLYLARRALELGLPLLAICRGAQVLAVAAGGSLVQDLPALHPGALKHRQPALRRQAVHPVQVVPGSLLHRLTGATELQVNSVHHQAVRALPAPFRPAALAPDGVLEAFELPSHPFCLALQWHPEDLAPTRPEQAALFSALVERARRP